MKSLIVSHAHPRLSFGGGEIAAYQEYQELKSRPDHQCIFVGVDSRSKLPFSSSIRPFEKDETDLLAYPGELDYFHISNLDSKWVSKDFSTLIREFSPDLVHFHHYYKIGMESIRAVKIASPRAKIALTLHEYLAICFNHGQMVKNNLSQDLCHRSNPIDCAHCFKDVSPPQFGLRHHFLRSVFTTVDFFIAPSAFLKQKYVDWGLPADKIHVIENGLPKLPLTTQATPPDSAFLQRFGFFGKTSALKGIDVLIKAIENLDDTKNLNAQFHIFGGGIEKESHELQKSFYALINRFPNKVFYHGRYSQNELPELMAKIDWVVVPSIWWENSPLVIQEAFYFGKPVICSDIGGMAEKVTHGKNGLHFRARDPASLVAAIRKCIADPRLQIQLSANIEPPPTIQDTVDQIITLFHSQ